MKFIKTIAILSAACLTFGAAQMPYENNNIVYAESERDYEIVTIDDIDYHVYKDHAEAYHSLKEGDIVIPDEVNGIPVTKITNLFLIYDKITSIVLPDTIVELEPSMCLGLKNLNSVKLPANITYIPQLMFSSCESLEEIEIPSGVTKIDGFAFRGCTSLKSVKLPEALTDIYSNAFENCSSLQSIEFPAGLTNIYERAFYKCTSLKEAKLPEKLESLGSMAFYECSLESLNIPKGITEIPDFCFTHNKFKEIVIPENVNLIYNSAFVDCPDVEKFTVLNPKCRFPANVMSQLISGRKEDENGKKYDSILNNCTFYGYKDSTLDKLAKTRTEKYNFVALDQETESTTTTSTTAVSTTTTSATTSSTVVSSSVSGQTTTTLSAPVKTVWGDANCDGEVDMSDVVLIMQSLANPNKYGVTGTDKNHITSEGLSNASVVNNNGSVTNNDAVKIQLFLLGKAAAESDK